MLKTKEEYLADATRLCKDNWIDYQNGTISFNVYADRRMIYLTALHEACEAFPPQEQDELFRLNQSQPWTKEY